MDLKLEVVVAPVSAVDRARRFYGSLGWRVDADFVTEGELDVASGSRVQPWDDRRGI